MNIWIHVGMVGDNLRENTITLGDVSKLRIITNMNSEELEAATMNWHVRTDKSDINAQSLVNYIRSKGLHYAYTIEEMLESIGFTGELKDFEEDMKTMDYVALAGKYKIQASESSFIVNYLKRIP